MTVVEWIPLFTNPEIVCILLDSLRFVQKEREVTLYAYVIMEKHLHLIASAPELSKTIKEFKSCTARKVINYVGERNAISLLEKLRQAKINHKKESEHQLWQEGSHPEEIFSEKMLIQKIEYIHNNPVLRGYVEEGKHWRNSSARNYEGMDGLLEICTDWSKAFIVNFFRFYYLKFPTSYQFGKKPVVQKIPNFRYCAFVKKAQNSLQLSLLKSK
jgi:REP element-mobilizing transposase RayT